MDAVHTCLTERESLLERLCAAYGFSECEAVYFADLGDNPVDDSMIHVELAA